MVVKAAASDPEAERSLLAAARIGDHQAFDALVAPHRREIHLHCYRMTGSLTDADDLVQESLLKAWRRIGTFQGRAPFRAWLYRIATNTCLNELTRRRRPRFLTPDGWSGGPSPIVATRQLQPYPDRLLDDWTDPVARYDQMESVALAFIAVMQLLAPRQRAVLILRDVLGWSTREVAASLDCSIASVNSALQRARGILRARLQVEGGADATTAAVTEISRRRLLARFMDAWERADFDALALLLREDAVLAMPPEPTWVGGRAAIIEFLAGVPAGGRLQYIRLLPIGANRQPAVAAFIAAPKEGGHRFYGVMVFEIGAEAISSITGFADPDLSDAFGLPAWLPPDQQDRERGG
jgi:RNA polymerase sigma-70 factor, ECF subfamily